MSEYQAFSGFVAFPPQERSAGGTPVKSVTIKLTNSPDATLVSASLFGELADLDINVGDVLLCEGKFSTNEKDGRTYLNVNVSSAVVIPTVRDAKKGSAAPSKPKVANAKPKVQY